MTAVPREKGKIIPEKKPTIKERGGATFKPLAALVFPKDGSH